MTGGADRILIIEDEALVARELKSRLTAMGYEVAGVAYGAEGIELARREQPDLLLTDIHLKHGEDGIAVAREIQAERDVPVVFLTAYSDEDTVSRAKSVTPYGYIIKPVENRELQIVIEMALYKFRIERELRETQQLLQTALTCIGTALVFVDETGHATDVNDDALRLLDRESAAAGVALLDLFSLDPESPLAARLLRAVSDSDVTKLPPFLIPVGDHSRLVDGIVGPREAGAVIILRELSDFDEPLVPLPGQAIGATDERRLTPSESSLCQLLVHVDGADATLSETANRLNQMLRSTDLVSTYGKQRLSVSLPYTAMEEGRRISQSILEALGGGDASISLGLAFAGPDERQPFEVFRRAARALEIAREAGGNRVVVWNDDGDADAAERDPHERERGYQHVMLLWNIMNLVVNTSDRDRLAVQLSEHLSRSFGFDLVAVLEQRGDAVMLLGGVAGDRTESLAGIGDLSLKEADVLALRGPDPAMPATSGDGRLVVRVAPNVCLFIRTAARVDERDLEFLQTLASYAGGALVRPLREPVVANERPVGRREILYTSPRMQGIMESVELVAPTDATVLIMGESGTGKESIARAIHESSHRSGKPFTIVDCGAVVGSLIESELFGHVKGAFTGADRDFSGRLKEADGGTVLLDEVGELPLDVQVKLLRFVQEQEIAAVGSNRYESVDTRIVAATNRDLKALVAGGEFREDLYYRLNVFSIETPPLRDREGDLMLLARHFLQEFAMEYGKQISGFTAEAEAVLADQRWPGNIRELMNVINRAVILCRDDRVSPIHLGMFPADPPARATTSPKPDLLAGWTSAWVSWALERPALPPLAQWLEEDLVEYALGETGGIKNRVAQLLGVPESTLRRKVEQGRDRERESGRPAASETMTEVFDALLEAARDAGSDAPAVIDTLVLKEVGLRGLSRRDAARLMGVSMPTLRRMLESP